MTAAAKGPRVATIGYETATQAEVVAALTGAGVARLIDVRAVASSRRAGFSKTLLASGLADAGIDYVHLRALGTPKAGRDAARAGRVAEMRAIYDAHLATAEAEAALLELERLVTDRPSALLCYEAEAHLCHRRALTERLEARLGARILDL